MEEALRQRFVQLLAARTGLQLRPQETERFEAAITARMKQLGLPAAAVYSQLLARPGAASEAEWQALVPYVTTGETLFFRDRGQCALLQRYLLPALLACRKHDRTLRIWSAGCATGEEPYSLAMMLQELLPRKEHWQLFILGTDLNAAAIAQARRGLYHRWSLRQIPPSWQQRYFRRCPGGWELDSGIRNMVTLQPGNLVQDAYPSVASGIYDMDLILCRNVFIYFTPEAVRTVVAKLAETLRPGGYLLTGHAELMPEQLGRLRICLFPESVVYQRPDAEDRCPAAPVSATLPQVPPKTGPVGAQCHVVTKPQGSQAGALSTSMATAEQLYRRKAYAAAIAEAKAVLQHTPGHLQALELIARAYANLGQYDEATSFCQQALAVDPCALTPYFLLAHIAEERGDMATAQQALRRVVYLDPGCIGAYVELGFLYARVGDNARAQKMRATALRLLHAVPPDAAVAPYEALTAAELCQQLQEGA